MNETPKKPKVVFGHWPMGAPVPLTREMIYDEDDDPAGEPSRTKTTEGVEQESRDRSRKPTPKEHV